MSKICVICGKGYLKGNQVPRGIGRRVTRRTTIRQEPNLRNKKFIIEGRSVTLRVCSSCLKRLRYEERKAAEAAKEQKAEVESTVEVSK